MAHELAIANEAASRLPAETRDRLLSPPPAPSLRRALRNTGWLSGAIIMLFFVFGGGWAASLPLAGATIASGVISPEGSRRTVQHLEGGIIREIKVKEGDRVAHEDILFVLEDTGAQAQVGMLSSRLIALAAKEARLHAERQEKTEIGFDHPVLGDPLDPVVQATIRQEINQARTRAANDASRAAILRQQVAQLEEQIKGHQRQLESVRRQKSFIQEELADVLQLYEKGYERKARVLALQRAEAELMGSEGELVADMARATEAIGEARLQIVNLRIDRAEQVDAELSETQAERAEVEERIKESLDQLDRTAILAPASGTIHNIRFKTPGGVIGPGEPILDIVPGEDDLLVEARISPQDIDDVRAGLPAYVIFPSYPQRNLHRIPGKVSTVSADTLQDETTGLYYYETHVKLDREELQTIAPEIELTPGMPAEVYIATVERTLLEYLLQPALQTIERTFREQ